MTDGSGSLHTTVRCLPQGCHAEGWRAAGPSSANGFEIIADGISYDGGKGATLHLCKEGNCASNGWTVMAGAKVIAEAHCLSTAPYSCFTEGWELDVFGE